MGLMGSSHRATNFDLLSPDFAATDARIYARAGSNAQVLTYHAVRITLTSEILNPAVSDAMQD